MIDPASGNPRSIRLAASADAEGGGSGESVTLIELASIFLRYWRTIGVLSLGVGLVAAGTALLKPRTYTASAAFSPQATDAGRTGLLGVAAQFGVVVPELTQYDSPEFYAELLTTRAVLSVVVQARYRVVVGSDTMVGSFAELNRVPGATAAARNDLAVRRLREALSVTARPQSGVVRIAVRARWAPLAEQVVLKLIGLVNEFNLKTRQSLGAAERVFIESRVEAAEADLRGAEDRLQGFLQQNREFRNSPHLTFTYDRLQREVGMRQALYTTLAEAYEQARIKEVRNTPLITVFEPPVMPVRADSRGVLLRWFLGLLIGALVGITTAFARESVLESRERHPEAFRQFLELRREVRVGLRTLRTWRASGK